MSVEDKLATLLTPFQLLKDLVLVNPLVTGPLYYVLSRGPENVRNTILNAPIIDKIAPYLNTPGTTVPKDKLVSATKWLLIAGVIVQLSKLMDRITFNKGSLRPQGGKFDFKSGKEIICITGGSSGFGALMVKDFANKTNSKIVVIDVQDFPKDLAALPRVTFYKCDLSNPSQIIETTNAIKAEIGDPTVLINNAGIGRSGLILDATPEWVEKIFRVNVISHWQTVSAFLPAMLKAKHGHIVTMASMASYVAVSNITDYCATKAGVLAFHEGLVQELKHRYENGRTIQTTIIHPNFAKTPLVTQGMASSGASKKHEAGLLAPETITNEVVKQVLSGQSAQIFVPPRVSRGAAVRGHATWFQEFIRDGASKLTAPPKA